MVAVREARRANGKETLAQRMDRLTQEIWGLSPAEVQVIVEGTDAERDALLREREPRTG